MTEKTYIGLVIKEPDTAYWVAFPDFKCCFTCGDSLSNAESTARDALETHIAGMVRDGFTVPEPSDINDILRDNDMAVVTLLEVTATIPEQAAANNVTLIQNAPRHRMQP